jgi:threonine synthase
VPTGNFGNIYAGYVALRMGLPVKRLILASNENNVLDEFFRTGRFRAGKSVQATSSPSMDISRASNFERYVFELLGRNSAETSKLFAGDEFTLAPGKEFVSGSSTHADRISTIKEVFSRYGKTIDPHTADGVKVGLAHREPGVPLICLETALPAKFAATIREALGREPDRPKGFEDLERLPQRFEVIPADVQVLKDLIERESKN